MNTGLIGVICFAFILVGSLFGLIRGWKNSLIRFFEVLACAFLAYFLAGSLSEAVMSVDLSSFGATIAGVTVSTLEQTLTDLLGSVGGISDLISASPTLNSVFAIIPLLLVSMVMFVILFFIAKFLVWIIHAIAGAIIRSKIRKNGGYDDDDGKKKSVNRLVGLLIGIFQGVLCFAVVMLPLAGTTYFLSDEVQYIRQYQEGTIIEENIIPSAYASEEANSIDEDLKESEESLNEINKKFRVLALFGYKSVSKNAVEGLTSFELNGIETSLTAEVDNIVKIYVRLDAMEQTPINNWTEKEIVAGHEAVELFFASPITGDIATEIIHTVADSWTGENKNNQTLLSYARPEIKDAGGQEVFEVFLKQLKTNTKEDMKNEFNAIVSLLEVCVNDEIVDMVETSTTIEDVMEPIGKDGIASDIIGAMAEGRAVRNTLPTVVQFGLNQMYPMLGVAEEDYKNLKVTKAASEINWETEKIYLGNVFAGLSRTYLSLQKDGAVLSKIDYESLGFALDNLRKSELLNSTQENGNSLAKEITLAIMNCSYLQDVNGIDGVLNNINENYESLNFTSLLKTLKVSVNIAESMSSVSGGGIDDVPADKIAQLLEGLNDETTGGLVKELAGKENLIEVGVDEASAGAVNSLVGAIVDYNTEANALGDGSVKMPTEEAEKNEATEAFKSLAGVIQSGNENEGNHENKFFESKDELRTFILDLKKSPYVYQVALSQSETLGFTDSLGFTKLTHTEYGYLEELMAEDGNTFRASEMVRLFGVKG